MPYDFSKDPFATRERLPERLGRAGRLVAPSDTTDLDPYARLRVWVPLDLDAATVKVLPVDNDDASPITLSLGSGQATVIEYVVRRVLATGTSAGLIIHTID